MENSGFTSGIHSYFFISIKLSRSPHGSNPSWVIPVWSLHVLHVHAWFLSRFFHKPQSLNMLYIIGLALLYLVVFLAYYYTDYWQTSPPRSLPVPWSSWVRLPSTLVTLNKTKWEKMVHEWKKFPERHWSSIPTLVYIPHGVRIVEAEHTLFANIKLCCLQDGWRTLCPGQLPPL